MFVSHLRLPHASPTTYDDVLVDSFGVLGVAPGPEPWLTGRGADGRLQLWTARDDDTTVESSSLDGIDAMWAAPATDAGTELLLSCHLAEGSWCLRTYDRQSAVAGGAPKARDLPLAGTPDTSFVLGCPEKDPLVVAGRARRLGHRTRGRSAATERRIHLSPAPSALTSVATVSSAGTPGSAGRGRPRGRVRAASAPVPRTAAQLHPRRTAPGARPHHRGGGRPPWSWSTTRARPARLRRRAATGEPAVLARRRGVEGVPGAGRSAGRPAPRVVRCTCWSTELSGRSARSAG